MISFDGRLPGSTDQKLRIALESMFRDVAHAVNRLDDPPITLTDGVTIAINASRGNNFRVQLAGNRTLANPTGLSDGQRIDIRVRQDATGGRTLAFGTMYTFQGGAAPALSTAPAALDLIRCQYDRTDDTLVCTFHQSFNTAYTVVLTSLLDDGVLYNGPGYYAGFRVAAPVAGTVNVYNGFSAAGTLIHTVTNPVAATWYYASGVSNVVNGIPASNERTSWTAFTSLYVTQPAQTADFLVDD